MVALGQACLGLARQQWLRVVGLARPVVAAKVGQVTSWTRLEGQSMDRPGRSGRQCGGEEWTAWRVAAVGEGTGGVRTGTNGEGPQRIGMAGMVS